jgi:hypothetical protein
MNFKDEDAQLIWEAHLLEALERDSETGEPQPVGLSDSELTSWSKTTEHLQQFTRKWIDEHKEKIRYLNNDQIQVLVLHAYEKQYPELSRTITEEVKIWLRWVIQTILWILMSVGHSQQDFKNIRSTGQDNVR